MPSTPRAATWSASRRPRAEELRHDFLWRVHPTRPGKGSVAIFNRSHYEDVLVVRVHDLVPEKVWRGRYRSINEWERMLAERGTTIVKFFLYIDRDEQRERLQARSTTRSSAGSSRPRTCPNALAGTSTSQAFEEALERTSTKWAPWYLIPANRKWFRNLAVAHVLGETLERLDPRVPAGGGGLEDIVIPK